MIAAPAPAEAPAVPNGNQSPRMAIRVEALWQRYGKIEAVRGIDLTVAEGEIFGLIGPDGAGKTSTFQVLAGVREATSGKVEVFGQPARDARSRTGYLTQTFSLYPDLTVAENIRYIGELRRVAPDEIKKRSLQYLKMFDMDRFADRLADKLSGGMKQKLALVCALVPAPRVLVLDEPTTGVDPVSRREFWDTLTHLSADGLTILVATPYLDEAERCHRVALLYKGQINQQGTPAELRASLHAQRLELRTANLAQAEQILLKSSGPAREIIDVQRFGDRLDLLVPDPDRAKQFLEKELSAAGLSGFEYRIDEPTLENTFVATLRALGEEVHAEPFPSRHEHKDLRGQVAIGAKDLNMQFGSFTAVKSFSLEIKYGEIFGLLGANGAGKTTVIKILCGLLNPTHGEMQLAGEHGSLRSQTVRQRIGYMSQKFSLYDDLSIEENLDFSAGVYLVNGEERVEKKNWVLSFSGLEGKQDQVIGSLPGGWKQRVALGAAIMHEPSVLFLDEPTSGVDPLARRAFWQVISRLADLGAAILVTTHYLEEAEQCNRIGFMVAGELVAEGTPSGIKGAQPGHLLEFIVDQPQRAADLLKKDMAGWRVSQFGERLHVVTDEDAGAGQKRITEQFAADGIKVVSAREGQFSLEDVFISVVEQARQQGRVAAAD
jgi:ABC-2 type transport system ATP-binding protein